MTLFAHLRALEFGNGYFLCVGWAAWEGWGRGGSKWFLVTLYTLWFYTCDHAHVWKEFQQKYNVASLIRDAHKYRSLSLCITIATASQVSIAES